MLIGIIMTQGMLLVISYIINNKNISKWILFFNLWWILLLVINIFKPYGGYQISEKGIWMIWLFLIFATFGYIIPNNKKNKQDYKNRFSINTKHYLNMCFDKIIVKNKLLNLIMIIFVLILLVYTFRYLKYVELGNIVNIRIVRFYVGYVFHSTIELLFFNYVVSMSRFFSIFIIAYCFIFKKYKSMVFLLSVINLLLYSFIGGSRFPFVMLGVEILVMSVFKKNLNKNLKKKKYCINLKKIKEKIIFFICILIIIFILVYLTAYRLGMTKYNLELFKESIGKFYIQCLSYNTLPLLALDKLLNDGVLKNNFYWGQVVLLNGIGELIYYVVSIMGGSFNLGKYFLGEICAKSITIGNTSFNALYTCIFWFYADMGIVGVIIYSFLFGYFTGMIVRDCLYRLTLWKFMLITHILYFFIMSNMNWDINTVDSLLYMLLIILYFRKKEIKLRDNINKKLLKNKNTYK